LYFVSPYLTGSRLLDFVRAHQDRDILVLVNLDPMSVSNGSLSVRDLERLADYCHLIHIPNLHAKIVTDGKTAIVGSQNLTIGGEYKNHEASIVTDHKETLEGVLFCINQMLQDSYTVTPEMLLNLKNIAPKLGNAVAQVEEVSHEFANSIEKNPLHTVIEQARERFLEDRFSNSYALQCTEIEVDSDQAYYSYWTLKRKYSDDAINDFTAQGIKHQNYLFALDARTLTPFWVPANKTQIGKFVQRMSGDGYRSWGALNDVQKTVTRWSIELVNPLEQADYSNIQVTLELGIEWNDPVWYLNYLFDGVNIYRVNDMFSRWVTINEEDVEERFIDRSEDQFLRARFKDLDGRIDNALLDLTLKSKYLGRVGMDPRPFFEPSETVYLSCWVCEDRPYYVFA